MKGRGEEGDLARRMKVGRAAVRRAIADLHRRGLLSVRPTNKPRAGSTKLYGPTLRGALEVLWRCSDEELRRVVEANRRLAPLVFGEWGFFREAGVEDLAIRRLRSLERILPLVEGLEDLAPP
jgi:hypothetical protein